MCFRVSLLTAVCLLSPIIVAGQCLSPTPNCTELVEIRAANQMLLYRSHPLSVNDTNITHAVVIIHGAERDAATSFRIAAAATVLAGRSATTLVLAPRFAANVGAACPDALAPNEISWECDVTRGDWRAGGIALNAPNLSSFDALDVIVQRIENTFPNLRSVVIAGHSAGGQFVTNYQMTNTAHDRVRVAPAYVTANASVYAYPDAWRPQPVTTASCASYQDWPFGVSARSAYVSQPSEAQFLQHARDRAITYLVGDLDTQLAEGGFYGSCAALAQGATRKERGVAFGNHMMQRYGVKEGAVVVPDCAHSESCMFMSRDGVRALMAMPR